MKSKIQSIYKAKAGTWFKATIKDTQVIGRIQKEDDNYYLCQNEWDGSDADNKLGFKYSWIVQKGTVVDLKSEDVSQLQLLKSKPKGFIAPKIPKSWIIGDYKATEQKGGILVGCTFVPDKLIKEIAKHRKLI